MIKLASRIECQLRLSLWIRIFSLLQYLVNCILDNCLLCVFSVYFKIKNDS